MSIYKPCKKCGEAVHIGYICTEFSIDENYFVYCYNCGNSSKVFTTKFQAIDDWNRRMA